jgi:hypothetical protein
MVDFFRAGGWMMFVVLATALPLLVTAAKFARNASPHRLSLIRALTMATVFASIGGTVTNLSSVFRHVVEIPELHKELVDNMLWGFYEALGPVILGFPLAAMAWILVAFGVRRMPAE